MKQLFVKFLCVACAACFLVACSDGDDDTGEYIPPYITDLLEVSSNEDGVLTTVTLDDGRTYDVSAQKKVVDAENTIFRCRATYTLSHEKMTLYGLAAVFVATPEPASSFVVVRNGVAYYGSAYIPRDPMKVVSMWKSGGYINLHLGLMTTGKGTHQYAFCEDSPGHYSLAHLRPGSDAESYTADVYMSMPIPEGVEELTFSVQTYDGTYTRTF